VTTGKLTALAFHAEMDLAIALSACSSVGCNGGVVKPLAYEIIDGQLGTGDLGSVSRAIADSNHARIVGGRRDVRERELAALERADALAANHPRMHPEAELVDEAEPPQLE
jgi:hypothetical protein